MKSRLLPLLLSSALAVGVRNSVSSADKGAEPVAIKSGVAQLFKFSGIDLFSCCYD